MWLIIRIDDSTVFSTAYQEPPVGAFDSAIFDVKEWPGAEPPIHDVSQGVESYDPTVDNLEYDEFVQHRLDYDELARKITSEIWWLNDHIPLVATADLDALRSYLKRVMRQQREQLKAWRYILRKLV